MRGACRDTLGRFAPRDGVSMNRDRWRGRQEQLWLWCAAAVQSQGGKLAGRRANHEDQSCRRTFSARREAPRFTLMLRGGYASESTKCRPQSSQTSAGRADDVTRNWSASNPSWDLEREAFVSLCGDRKAKTQERIAHHAQGLDKPLPLNRKSASWSHYQRAALS